MEPKVYMWLLSRLEITLHELSIYKTFRGVNQPDPKFPSTWYDQFDPVAAISKIFHVLSLYVDLYREVKGHDCAKVKF